MRKWLGRLLCLLGRHSKVEEPGVNPEVVWVKCGRCDKHLDIYSTTWDQTIWSHDDTAHWKGLDQEVEDN